MRTAISAILVTSTVLCSAGTAYADVVPDPVESTGTIAIVIGGVALLFAGGIITVRYLRRIAGK
jgi:hypothetical protein